MTAEESRIKVKELEKNVDNHTFGPPKGIIQNQEPKEILKFEHFLSLFQLNSWYTFLACTKVQS